MDRRQFLFALSGMAAWLGGARAGHAECGGPTSTEFVEGHYHRQAELLAANTPAAGDEFYDVFSRRLRRLMKAPRRYPKNMPTGILNAFFGPGVLPGTVVTIEKTRLVSGDDEGPATVGVEIKSRGERRSIEVRLIKEKEVFRIANITWDGDRNLVEHYRGITGR